MLHADGPGRVSTQAGAATWGSLLGYLPTVLLALARRGWFR